MVRVRSPSVMVLTKDHNGRVFWTLVEINTKMLLIIGTYAPSQGDDPKFFKDEVFHILDKVNSSSSD